MPDFSTNYYADRDNTRIGNEVPSLNPRSKDAYVNKSADDVMNFMMGFIPGVGEFMDGIDLYNSIKKGDMLGAALAGASLIPVLGDFVPSKNMIRGASNIISDGSKSTFEGLTSEARGVSDDVRDEVQNFFIEDVLPRFIDKKYDKIYGRMYDDLDEKESAIFDLIKNSGYNDFDSLYDGDPELYDKVYDMMSELGNKSVSEQNISLALSRNHMREFAKRFVYDKNNFRAFIDPKNKYFIENKNVAGFYSPKKDVVVLKRDPSENISSFLHEIRHKMEDVSDAKITDEMRASLNKSYSTSNIKGENRKSIVDGTDDLDEKMATNIELRYAMYKEMRERFGKDRKYTPEDLDNYINSINPYHLVRTLEGLNSYGKSYARNIFNKGIDGEDVFRKAVDDVRESVIGVPSFVGAAYIGSKFVDGMNEEDVSNQELGDGGLVEKQDHIYERLTDEYDIPPLQAVAIVANLTHESGLRDDAIGDSGASFGIQQWKGDRRKKLESFAKSRYHEVPTLDDQVDFLMGEYNTNAFQFKNQGRNLYASGAVSNPIFDYYQYSKYDFDNASNLYDATIAWNQGVGRPNKKYAYNDRRYEIAKGIAERHGVDIGGDSHYTEMGYNVLPDLLVQAPSKPSQPAGDIPSQKEREDRYMAEYGNDMLADLLSYGSGSVNIHVVNPQIPSQNISGDEAAEMKRIELQNRREQQKRLLEAVLPNIGLNIPNLSK